MPKFLRTLPERGFRRRARAVAVLFCAVCLGLAVRLFFLQVRTDGFYADRAQGQQLRDTVVPADRGRIYSADGQMCIRDSPCTPASAPALRHRRGPTGCRLRSSSCGVHPGRPDRETADRRWEPPPQSWQCGLFRRRCPASDWCRFFRPPGSPGSGRSARRRRAPRLPSSPAWSGWSLP